MNLDRKETELRNHDSGRDPGGAVSGTGSTAVMDDAAKTAELRRQGEEFYSLGMFQEAIHVWTRILFLDRGNAEARQRIEAAKRAVAERHRELDSKAAEASRLLESGDVEGARSLLGSVLSVDSCHADAVALTAKLAAIERRAELSEIQPPQGSAGELAGPAKGILLRVPKGQPPPARRVGASRLKMTAFLLGAVLAFAASALYLLENWDSLVSDGTFGRGALSAGARVEHPPTPVPDLSEIHYYHGVRLFQQERYREALAELDRLDGASPWIVEARSLTMRIEERLLRGTIEASPPTLEGSK